jgi:hypothetical protein
VSAAHDHAELVEVLADSYRRWSATVADLPAAAYLRATGAEGWCVLDLLHHQLSDAQRVLVALHTPADGPADTDRVTYWQPFGPAGRYVAASDSGLAGAWFTRRAAAAFGHRPDALAGLWAETAAAAVHAARGADPGLRVATQGYVLDVADFIATAVVEVSVHSLDLAVAAADHEASPAGLAVVRGTLDGLLGVRLGDPAAPVAWSDEEYARAGTGRRALTHEERARLGDRADRFPLLA